MKSRLLHIAGSLFASLLFTVAAPNLGRAQTTLSAGGIAFTGFNNINNAYPNSEFSFVLLQNISSNTTINFTDIGWNPVTSSLVATGSDAAFSWTSSSAMTKFTEVTIKVNYAAGGQGTTINSVSHGTATNPVGTGNGGAGTGFVLSGAGDQVLAYQGTQASPTFIAAIHMNQEVANGTSAASSLSTWDDIKASGGWAYSANRSGIPPGLTNGTNAVMVVTGASAPFTEYDYAEYNCTGSNTSATDAALLAAINNRDNWSVSNATAYTLPSGCSFVLAAAPVINTQPSSSTICAGGNTSFTVSASNATGYQWQVNTGSGFSNISNGGVYSNATTSTLNITGATAGMNGYQYQVVVTGSSSVTSNAVTLTVNSPGTWLGGTSTAWSNTANWTCGTLPTSSTNVTIPAGTTFSPQVDITTAAANNLTIASGATLSFSGSTNILSISGAVTATGTFNTANGRVAFAGGTQTIPALSYSALQMNGAGTKTLAGNITVSGTLTLTNGYIQLGSSTLTIGSGGNITGQNSNSFVVTNGTGGLIQQNIGSGGRTGNIAFPVGASTTSYTPLAINNATGTADNFTARVINNVYTAYNASDVPTGTALTSNAVAKTWLISEATAGGSSAAVTVQWNGADELSGFNNSACYVSHYSTTNGWTPASTATAAGGFDPYTLTATGVTSFSPFGVGSGTALPLQLLAFTGERRANEAFLQWATADERGCAGYSIERSVDGLAFEAVGFKAAVGANSNRYNFQVALVEGVNNFFRLKMIDADGSYSYSSVVKMEGAARAGGIKISPVPAVTSVMITNTDVKLDGSNVRVTDVQGRLVHRFPLRASQRVDVSAWPAGIYFVRFEDGGVLRLVKE